MSYGKIIFNNKVKQSVKKDHYRLPSHVAKMKTARTRTTVFIAAKIKSDLYAKKTLGLKQIKRIQFLCH